MKKNQILVKTTILIAVLLVIALIIYFLTVPDAKDKTWDHTYFPGSILLICFVGLVVFLIQKNKQKRSKNESSQDEGENASIDEQIVKKSCELKPQEETTFIVNGKINPFGLAGLTMQIALKKKTPGVVTLLWADGKIIAHCGEVRS